MFSNSTIEILDIKLSSVNDEIKKNELMIDKLKHSFKFDYMVLKLFREFRQELISMRVCLVQNEPHIQGTGLISMPKPKLVNRIKITEGII